MKRINYDNEDGKLNALKFVFQNENPKIISCLFHDLSNFNKYAGKLGLRNKINF